MNNIVYCLFQQDLDCIITACLETISFAIYEALSDGWQVNGLSNTGTMSMSIALARLPNPDNRLTPHEAMHAHMNRLVHKTNGTLNSFKADLDEGQFYVFVTYDLTAPAHDKASHRTEYNTLEGFGDA